MKKALSLILALLLLCSTLLTVGCSNKEDDETGDYSMEVSTADDGTRYDENGYLMDDLPEDLDWDGKEINILTCEEFAPSVCPTEINNTALNDTSYTRNKIIEERLGVKLNFVLEMGVATSTANLENFAAAVNNAGSGDYDLICAFSPSASSFAINGSLRNIKDASYVDFKKPWWSESVLENSFYDSIYYASTNCSGTVLEQMIVIYYNRTILANNGIDDPAKDVLNKKWTIDKLYKYSKNLYEDLNRDEKKNADDRFGLTFGHYVMTDAFYYGAGFTVVNINEGTGLPELTLYDNDSALKNAYDLVNGLKQKLATDDCFVDGVGDASDPKIMMDNRTAFYCSILKIAGKVPDSKDWGVIPVPMLNEEQGKYIVTANNDFDMWCIPKVALAPDMSAAFMEAYASGCYRTVAPKYYDENLSYRYSSDSDGLEIFQLIREGMKFDFGRVSGMAIGTFDEYVLRPCYRGGDNFVQTWEVYKKSAKTKLNNLLKVFEEQDA
ncbi:MAG: extracellular solute-binding protein [Clostridia bacterium]|nr:extracellular solute-binding protein [Clostridia bacterium]